MRPAELVPDCGPKIGRRSPGDGGELREAERAVGIPSMQSIASWSARRAMDPAVAATMAVAVGVPGERTIISRRAERPGSATEAYGCTSVAATRCAATVRARAIAMRIIPTLRGW